MKTKSYYLECVCSSAEHLATFAFDVEQSNNEPLMYVQLQLAGVPFLKRVVNAFKYIFGYECRYGHWDEVVLNPSKVRELKQFLDDYESYKDTLRIKTQDSGQDGGSQA